MRTRCWLRAEDPRLLGHQSHPDLVVKQAERRRAKSEPDRRGKGRFWGTGLEFWLWEFLLRSNASSCELLSCVSKIDAVLRIPGHVCTTFSCKELYFLSGQNQLFFCIVTNGHVHRPQYSSSAFMSISFCHTKVHKRT